MGSSKAVKSRLRAEKQQVIKWHTMYVCVTLTVNPFFQELNPF